MSQIILEIPEETLQGLKLSPQALGEELRLVAAVKWYELGRLSSGAAARLAGMPRTVFLSKLGDFGVATFRLSEEELRRDLENAPGVTGHER